MSVVKPGYSEGRRTQRHPQCRMSHTGLLKEGGKEKVRERGKERVQAELDLG